VAFADLFAVGMSGGIFIILIFAGRRNC